MKSHMMNKTEVSFIRSFFLLGMAISVFTLRAYAATLTESFDSSSDNYTFSDNTKLIVADGKAKLKGGSTLVKSDNSQANFDAGTYDQSSYNSGKVAPTSASKVLPVDLNMSGLVSYWDFEDGSGTTVTDRKSGLNGTFGANAPAFSTDAKSGKYSLSFNPLSKNYAKVSSSSSLNLGNNLTISAWIKLSSISGTQTIYAENAGSGTNRIILRVNSSGSVEVNASASGTNIVAASSNTGLLANTWYHIVYTKNGSGATHMIYVNGLKQTLANNTTTNFDVTGADKYIGSKDSNGTDPFNGLIDEVAVFNRALTQTEVLQLFHYAGHYTSATADGTVAGATQWTKFLSTQSVNFGEPLEKPPVLYLKMDDGSGSTATDAVGNSNGILNNAAWSDTIPSVAFSNSKSLSFNGTSAFVEVPNQSSLNPSATILSISVWVNTTTAGSVLLSKGSVGNNGYSLKLDTNGYPQLVKEGVSGGSLTGTKSVSDGAWHHVGAVASSNGMSLYLDGVLHTSNSNTSNFAAQTASLFLGKSSAGSFYSGLMDELAVYDRALSASDMAALASGRKRPHIQSDNYEKNLVALYHLDNDGVDNVGTNDGVFNNGISFREGVMGPAAVFNGNNYMSVSTFPNLGSSFTFSVWVNTPNIVNNGTDYILGSNGSGIQCAVSPNGAVIIYKGGDVIAQTNDNALKANVWTHIVYTRNNTSNAIYLNGISQTLKTDSSTSFSENSTKYLGSSNSNDDDNNNSHYFIGAIDEVAFFTIALSSSQVNDIYKRGAARVRFQVRTGSADPPASTWSGGGASNRGVVSIWHLNETTGQTVVDSSPNAFNGTLGADGNSGSDDPTIGSAGKIGNSFYFDGKSDFVNMAHQSALNPSSNVWTLSAWIKTSTAGGGIVSKGTSGTNGYELSLDSNGKAVFKKSAVTLTGVQALNDNNWHHVATVASSSGMYLYVDGILDANNTDSTSFVSQSAPLTIGKSSSYFKGNIDDVAVFNRALSGTEVWELYQSGNYVNLLDGEFLQGLNQDRYLNYQAFFWTADATASGDIQSVSIYTNNYPTTNPTVTPNANASFNYLTSFTETATKPPGTEIKYVLSGDNGSTWYYFNGSAWATSDGTYSQASTASDLNTNIAGFDDKAAPSAAGKLKFKAFLNSNGTDTPALDRIDIGYEAATITVTAPNGSESWAVGDAKNITWSTTGNVPGDLVLEYAVDGISFNQSITSGLAASPYSWTIPNNVSSSLKVRIRSASVPSINDTSDNTFSIYNPAASLNSLTSSVGASSDSSSAASLFGKLAWITSNVSTLLTNVGTVNSKADTLQQTANDIQSKTNDIKTSVGSSLASDVSLVKTAVGAGQSNTLYSQVSNLVTTIGASADTSSQATVFGKIKSVGDNVNNVATTSNAIQKKTDTINWDDVTGIKKQTDTIADVKAKTDTINWTDVTTVKNNAATLVSEIGTGNIAAIKTKTDTVNWADVTGLVTTSGAIKAKTDNINWADVTGIKTKTDTIAWGDVTGIKAKTDTVDWTDVTTVKNNASALVNEIGVGNIAAMRTKINTINWDDVTGLVTKAGDIKVKTDKINWDDVAAVKTKTDTINWTDVTAIKAKTDTINWTDVTNLTTTSDDIKKATSGLGGVAASSAMAQSTFSEVLKLKEIMTNSNQNVPAKLDRIQQVMDKMSQSVYSLTGTNPQTGALNPNAGDAVNLQTVHSAVTQVAQQVQELAKQNNINLSSVVQQVAANQGQNAKEIQNQILEVQAVAKTTQEIVTRQANTPVMTTWFETGSGSSSQKA